MNPAIGLVCTLDDLGRDLFHVISEWKGERDAGESPSLRSPRDLERTLGGSVLSMAKGSSRALRRMFRLER